MQIQYVAVEVLNIPNLMKFRCYCFAILLIINVKVIVLLFCINVSEYLYIGSTEIIFTDVF